MQSKTSSQAHGHTNTWAHKHMAHKHMGTNTSKQAHGHTSIHVHVCIHVCVCMCNAKACMSAYYMYNVCLLQDFDLCEVI